MPPLPSFPPHPLSYPYSSTICILRWINQLFVTYKRNAGPWKVYMFSASPVFIQLTRRNLAGQLLLSAMSYTITNHVVYMFPFTMVDVDSNPRRPEEEGLCFAWSVKSIVPFLGESLIILVVPSAACKVVHGWSSRYQGDDFTNSLFPIIISIFCWPQSFYISHGSTVAFLVNENSYSYFLEFEFNSSSSYLHVNLAEFALAYP